MKGRGEHFCRISNRFPEATSSSSPSLHPHCGISQTNQLILELKGEGGPLMQQGKGSNRQAENQGGGTNDQNRLPESQTWHHELILRSYSAIPNYRALQMHDLVLKQFLSLFFSLSFRILRWYISLSPYSFFPSFPPSPPIPKHIICAPTTPPPPLP